MTLPYYNPLVATMHVSFKTLQNHSLYWPEYYLAETMKKPELYDSYGIVMNMVAYSAGIGFKANPDISAKSTLLAALQQDINNPVYTAMMNTSLKYQTQLEKDIIQFHENGLTAEDEQIIQEMEQKKNFARDIFSGNFPLDGYDFDTLMDAADLTDECLARSRRKKLPAYRL